MAQAPNSVSPSVENFHEVRVAAQKMGIKIGESGREFDRLACLSYSGYITAAIVAQALGFSPQDSLSLPISRNIERESDADWAFKVGSMPSKDEVKGWDYLLVGDVWRTGELMRFAASKLGALGAKSVSIGVLYLRTDYAPEGPKPDFFGIEVSDQVEFEWHRTLQGYEPITPVRRHNIPVDNL